MKGCNKIVNILQEELDNIKVVNKFRQNLANLRRMPEMCGIIHGKIDENEYNINGVLFPEQNEARGDHCEVKSEDIIRMLRNMPEGDRFLGWFHTHPDLKAWFSGTDLETQKSLQKYANSGDMDILGVVYDPIQDDLKAFCGGDSKNIEIKRKR